MSDPNEQLICSPHQKDILAIARQMKLTGTFVEIGTFGGHFAYEIMHICAPQKLYCIDPYESYADFQDAMNLRKLDDVYAEARQRLAPFGDRVEFMRMFSEQAAGNFADGSLDFVYIDGNHSYSYVLKDFENWYPKVREGGLICGDDAIDYHDDSHRNAQGDVRFVWTQDAQGKPESWGHYGVLKAAREFSEREGLKLYQAGTQCLIFKGCELKVGF